MRLIVILTGVFWLALAARAEPSPQEDPPLRIGDTLPILKGTFLTGEDASLPAASSGRVALLALGFTYDSRFAVEEWCGRFEAEFKGRPEVTFYEIPMISGMARLAKWFINRGMRKGTPPEKHRNVITVYGGADPWKSRVGFKDPDNAYLILLDGRGGVRWLHSGRFDTARFEELASLARNLIGVE